MTLRFASSMGEIHQPAQMDRYWASSLGLSGGLSLGLMSDLALNDASATILTPTFTLQNTWIMQGAFKNSDFLSGANPQNAGLYFFKGGAEQLSMVIVPAVASGGLSDGYMYGIEVRRGAVVLAASDPIFFSQEWTVFQFKATLNTGVLGSFEVKASRRENETQEAFTSIVSGVATNTADTGVAGGDQVEINYDVKGGNAIWDHFWVMDDQGAVNNDFPNKLLMVHGMVPDADGAQDDWIPQGGQGTGFQTVDDPANSLSDDIGRQIAENIGDIFLTAFPDPGVGHPISSAANIAGVIFTHVSAMENSGTLTVRPIYRNAGDVRAEGADQALAGTAYAGYFEVFEEDPVALAAWTVAQVKAMQWGLKVQS